MLITLSAGPMSHQICQAAYTGLTSSPIILNLMRLIERTNSIPNLEVALVVPFSGTFFPQTFA